MTPAARIAAVIEVLQASEGSLRPGDEIATGYFRSRRYIGSKDRRAISERIFAIERCRARLDWWTGTTEPRTRVIADLALNDGLAPGQIAALFDGSKFAPPALSGPEADLAARLSGKTIDEPTMPIAVRLELPDWIVPRLRQAWGESIAEEMTALNGPAPLDLRTNILKGDRNEVIAKLADDGIVAEPTPLSPIGLRVRERANISAARAYKNGLVEIQDEASQVAAILCGAKADRLTIDLCAGAGGKTLALAAAMKDGGPLIACDTDERRFRRIEPRLKRAGVSNVTRKPLRGLDDPWLAGQAGRAARVLVDAPCSGSGAWRRDPGARWRLTPDRLDQLIGIQRTILERAAPLVAPGGRLIYVTCSVLYDENDAQADWFSKARTDFQCVPIETVWAETIGSHCPGEGPYLHLTPHRNGTDGFFVAVFERTGA